MNKYALEQNDAFSLFEGKDKLQNTKNLTIHISYYWITSHGLYQENRNPLRLQVMVIVLELAQPALLIINVTLQSPRQVLKSSFPVSTILPSCRQRSFSLPFLGAKSLLRRKSLRSCFQSKPVYGVPATAKSSTKIHFHGSCFLPWRVLNSLCQWENQLSSACFGAERDYFPKWCLAIHIHIPYPLQILTSIGMEKGVTVAQAWHCPHRSL